VAWAEHGRHRSTGKRSWRSTDTRSRWTAATGGFAVTYVQNITDVDDKIIRRARELRIDASELARMYERAYLDDMLRCATTPWTCTRAPATTSTKSSARSSACSRRARRHQGPQLDAQLVEIIHRLGGSTSTSLPRADPRRDRACPVDLGVRVAARVVDALDVYAGHLHHAASS
jgi:hypothetical protein